MPELDDQLGQVGLDRRDAGCLERLVEPDLLRHHRLDLDDLGDAGRQREADHDAVGLVRVAGPVHDAAPGGDGRLELQAGS